MTTATVQKNKSRDKESPYKRLHVIIPIEDMLWASRQKPSANQLWQECWMSDPYGSRWMPLKTDLGYSSFIAAKKVLSDSGLFIFKPDKSIQDGRETVGWMVRNLHGSRIKEFWAEQSNSEKQEFNCENSELDCKHKEIDATDVASISPQTLSPQASCGSSRTPQEHLTNSFEEFVRCDSCSSDPLTSVEEAPIAPLGGALPPIPEEQESEEDVIHVCSVPPSEDIAILRENVDTGLGQSSAAPPGESEVVSSLYSKEAIAERMELRPQREKRLLMIHRLGDEPDFDFLCECWQDLPLKLKIKKLLQKHPEWGIEVVDNELVRTGEPPWDEIAQQMENL